MGREPHVREAPHQVEVVRGGHVSCPFFFCQRLPPNALFYCQSQGSKLDFLQEALQDSCRNSSTPLLLCLKAANWS